jgi:hypothetical protein
MWFTQPGSSQIGRIDPSGPNAIQEYPVPSGGQPFAITAGPDGNLWFTEGDGAHVGRVLLKPYKYHLGFRLLFVPNNFDAWWWLYNNPHGVAVLSDVLYTPAKAAFATLGVAASGLTYVATLGSATAAVAVWDASTRGDYAITPDMVRRHIAPRFIGSSLPEPAPLRYTPIPPFLPQRARVEAATGLPQAAKRSSRP